MEQLKLFTSNSGKPKPKKSNKWIYGYKLWVNYGQGYEYEIFEESRAEIKARKKEYQENCPQYPLKITGARVLNEAGYPEVKPTFKD